MPRGDIDAYRPVMPGLLPTIQLRQHLIHDPFTDIDNQVCLFNQRQKLLRRHQAFLWMLPAQQGFETHDLTTAHIDLGLKMQAQFIGASA
jgi:hypothetical protein